MPGESPAVEIAGLDALLCFFSDRNHYLKIFKEEIAGYSITVRFQVNIPVERKGVEVLMLQSPSVSMVF